MKKLDPIRNPMDRLPHIIAGIGVLTSSALIFNLLPVLLGAFADSLQLLPHQIGLLGGTYMFGFTFASLPAVYLIENTNWRRITAVASIVVTTCLIIASRVDVFVVLLAFFGVIGLAKGTLFGLANRVLGSTSDPDRMVGIGYFVELVVPAVLIILFAAVIGPTFGHIGVLVTLGLVILALGIASTPLMPVDARDAAVDHELPKEKLTPDIVLGLLSAMVLFIGSAGTWAFVERIGVSQGIDQSTVGAILSFGLFLTALGSLLPMLTEQRIRRSTMLFVIAAAITTATYLLDTRSGVAWYFIATSLFNLAWGGSTVYVTASVADADTTGRFIVLIGGAIGLGAALGPSFAGFLVDGDSYTKVFIMTSVALFAAATLLLLSGRARRKRRAQG